MSDLAFQFLLKGLLLVLRSVFNYSTKLLTLSETCMEITMR